MGKKGSGKGLSTKSISLVLFVLAAVYVLYHRPVGTRSDPPSEKQTETEAIQPHEAKFVELAAIPPPPEIPRELKEAAENVKQLQKLFGFDDHQMSEFFGQIQETANDLPEMGPGVPCNDRRSCAQEAYSRMHRSFHARGVLPLRHPWQQSPGEFDGWYDRVQIKPLMKRVVESKVVHGPTCVELSVHDYIKRLWINECKDIIVLNYEGDEKQWGMSGADENHVRQALGDIHQLHKVIPEGTVDSFICTQSYQLFREPLVAAKEIFRSLKPGGGVLITNPLMQEIETDGSNDFYRYTKDGMRFILEQAGFEVIEATGFGSLKTITGFLQGMDARYWTQEEMELTDDNFYNIVGVLARKPK